MTEVPMPGHGHCQACEEEHAAFLPVRIKKTDEGDTEIVWKCSSCSTKFRDKP